eukprot:TRINITY_DN180_c0_g1_i1.p1 TRINITY_DN180_c0_g1~~TRINITY_DN180_c0_g1_i1.p1  ORF type:complete len:679 (-),score=117.01 TRINITY_DN180_c0_g1_i1:2269-4305(-)
MKYSPISKVTSYSPRQPICNLPKKFSSKFLTSNTSPRNVAGAPKSSPSKGNIRAIPTEFVRATEYITKSPGDTTPNSAHSIKTVRSPAEIKLLQVPPGTQLVRKHATSPPSRNSSIHSKGSGYTTERLSGERERQLEGIIQKMRTELDKYKATIEQNTNAWRIMQCELKNTANNYMKQAEDVRAELEKLRSTYTKQQKELQRVKEDFFESNNYLNLAITHLSDCKNTLQGYQTYVSKSLNTVNSGLTPQEKVNTLRKFLNDSNELSHFINMEALQEFVDTLATHKENLNYRESIKESVQPITAKQEHELSELRTTNAILLEHALELERAIGEIESTKAIRDADMCWGIKEILSLCKEKEQLQEMHNTLKSKYEAYLKRPIPPAKITKLAQILAYLPKRRRQFKAQQDTIVLELREEIKRLRKEMEKRDEENKRKYNDMVNRYNALMNQYVNLEGENSKLRLENAELRRKIEELLGLIKLKDSIIDSLKKDLEAAKEQIDKLLQEIEKLKNSARGKDMLFAEKMKEMKQMFEEMRKEKDDKQKEIILLREKIAKLEKELADLKAKLAKALEDLSTLTAENEGLKDEVDRYFSAGTLDGFRALISLANMILARMKRPPPLSTKDKQLIKEIFDANIKGMLDEIAKLQEESKIYREEMRKLLSQKECFINFLKTRHGKVDF